MCVYTVFDDRSIIHVYACVCMCVCMYLCVCVCVPLCVCVYAVFDDRSIIHVSPHLTSSLAVPTERRIIKVSHTYMYNMCVCARGCVYVCMYVFVVCVHVHIPLVSCSSHRAPDY